MTTRVCVTNLSDDRAVVVRVLEKSEDGRELQPNGERSIKPGDDREFLVDSDAVLQITEGEEQ